MAIYNAIMAFTGWMWTLPMLIVLIGGGLRFCTDQAFWTYA